MPKVKPRKVKIRSKSEEGLRKFDVGDKVKVRVYLKCNTWVDGVIYKTLGSKMYDILVDDNKIIRRHIDQLRRSHKIESNLSKSDCNDYDWAYNAGDSKVHERRYPVRDRRKPVRYGIDE